MLNRIFVGLAIVASIFVAAFGFFSVKPKIETMVEQRKTEKEGREKAERERDDNKKKLDSTTKKLQDTETRLRTTTEEKNNALAEAQKQKKLYEDRTAEYNKTKDERDVARAELFVWSQLGVTPDQIKGMVKQIADLLKEREVLAEEKRVFVARIQKLADRISFLIGDNNVVELPAGLRGKVVAVDPKLEFCVLDFGENKGARERGELLVSRNGQLIAKLRIHSVESDRCIANVVSGYLLHDMLEGDVVFPANN